MRLTQGFGRLIRNDKEDEKGLFICLDRRDFTIKNLKQALPVRCLQRRSTEPDEMQDWFINEGLTHLGLKAEFEGRNIDLRNITIPRKPPPASGRPSQRR